MNFEKIKSKMKMFFFSAGLVFTAEMLLLMFVGVFAWFELNNIIHLSGLDRSLSMIMMVLSSCFISYSLYLTTKKHWGF